MIEKAMMKKRDMCAFNDSIGSKENSIESGFTLIELLVALLIGTIVIAVVGSLFLANTNTFRAVDDASRLQENGRFALQTIARVTRQAGFAPPDVLQLVKEPKDAFPATTFAAIAPTTARIVYGVDGAGPNSSDSLTVAFRPSVNGEVIDCTGSQLARAAIPDVSTLATIAPVTNTFFVAASDVVDTTSNYSLFCVPGPPGTPRIELIRGVESFQVLYAVDVGGDFVPNYYTSANQLSTGTGELFNSVLGIQIALVLRGGEGSTLDSALTGSKLTLNLFGTATNGTALYDGTANSDAGARYTISAADPANARRTFKVITTTINLRNRSA
jgi:type IV pilus assembly protein PilW